MIKFSLLSLDRLRRLVYSRSASERIRLLKVVSQGVKQPFQSVFFGLFLASGSYLSHRTHSMKAYNHV